MKLDILDKTKKRKILERLERFGKIEFPWLLIRSGKDKVRAYSGALSRQEVISLSRLLKIEGVGMYFAKDSGEEDIRLTSDALHSLENLGTKFEKNVIALNKSQEENWFRGEDIELEPNQIEKDTKGFVVVKSKETKDLIGMGRLSSNKEFISNFIPKERRIKDRIIK